MAPIMRRLEEGELLDSRAATACLSCNTARWSTGTALTGSIRMEQMAMVPRMVVPVELLVVAGPRMLHNYQYRT